jgi:hypothetical protein
VHSTSGWFKNSHSKSNPETRLESIRWQHFGQIAETWNHGDLSKRFPEDERLAIFRGALHVYKRFITLLAAVANSEQNYLSLALACIWLSAKYLSMVDKRMCVQMIIPFDDPSHSLLRQVVNFESRVANDPGFTLPLHY